MNPKTVDKIIMSTICLHNYLMTINDSKQEKSYCPSNFIGSKETDGTIIYGTWRNECSNNMERISSTIAHRSTVQAYK